MDAYQRAIFHLLLVLFMVIAVPVAMAGALLFSTTIFVAAARTAATRRLGVWKRNSYRFLLPGKKKLWRRAAVNRKIQAAFCARPQANAARGQRVVVRRIVLRATPQLKESSCI